MPAGMPPQTREVCLANQTAQTPGMDEGSCTLLESSKSGNRALWKAKCKDGSTVSGDFTYEDDSTYRGVVSYQGGQGDMLMKISGRRLGGSCQLASLPSPASDVGPACDQGIASLNGSLFFGSSASCAARRKEFCDHLNNMTLEEYASVREQVDAGRDPNLRAVFKQSGVALMEDAIKDCGTTPAVLETKACSEAVSRQQYDFVGEFCPAQSAELKRKHCEGRDYTALMRSPDIDMCYALGFDERAYNKPQGQATLLDVVPTSREDAADRLIQEGASRLKSFLGF